MPAKLRIEEITAAQTWPIRQESMWPNEPLAFVQLPEDESGVHFGAFVGEELISVISLFLEGEQAQFRKFATRPAFQRQGIGQRLLQHVFTYAATHHVSSVWCHARITAQSFYQNAGMEVVGEPFQKNGLMYVRMQKFLTNG
ncbi:GNAT family N-acetyltransferase [Rufibacter immobilis]|uniref:GNAT family N-acetyltransferase n=1 Tax=Rufibacter immobilis TaxID=1348778 RepID=A0A3M9MQC8_9BACT|nr:GNAT family N-acetyltransferase [Rufibacter immobilis]RNI27417.1 GNAT family N-acetyltransferase [Rufibacter immobilis]